MLKKSTFSKDEKKENIQNSNINKKTKNNDKIFNLAKNKLKLYKILIPEINDDKKILKNEINEKNNKNIFKIKKQFRIKEKEKKLNRNLLIDILKNILDEPNEKIKNLLEENNTSNIEIISKLKKFLKN